MLFHFSFLSPYSIVLYMQHIVYWRRLKNFEFEWNNGRNYTLAIEGKLAILLMITFIVQLVISFMGET